MVGATAAAPEAKPAAGGQTMVEATVSVITPALAQLLIFLGSLLFFLWSRVGSADTSCSRCLRDSRGLQR